MNEREIKITKAFIQQKFNAIRKEEDLSGSDMVRKTMVHLWQLGIWEEAKDVLKDYILEYFGFFEDAEFSNGEVKKKRVQS